MKTALRFCLTLAVLFSLVGVSYSNTGTVMGLSSPTEDFAEYLQNKNIDAETSQITSAIVQELNQARINPVAYGKQIGVDLSMYQPVNALQTDVTLTKIAQTKAEDMHLNRYFSHTDKWGKTIHYWLVKANYPAQTIIKKNLTENYIESLAYNDTGESPVRQLIIDEGIPDKAHRQHLLSYQSTPTDTHVGIGYKQGYTVVLITSPIPLNRR